MLGYILCGVLGVLFGVLLMAQLHSSHDADILSEKIMENVERGEKKLEE